ncbi:MAG: phenylalanine--tRNA ligase subunit beta [Candidatus Woesebacteria bacterium]|nr:phenylalanine--tRNA ligase subunit beta [Candidatus Woesebacteria bacterium]
MDLIIPKSWLEKFLETKATAKEFAKYLSLCGPSVERTKKLADGDHIFSIEITTNRVDTASVIGIAREASTILPRFGIKAKFKEPVFDTKNYKFVNKVKYLNPVVDSNLCSRFTAVLIRNVKVGKSPDEITSLLKKVGVRSINNIVDVSNYVMHELGQPVHTFDYDKIKGSKMILRESKKDEIITTLDGKTFKLPGGDIVIEDGDKRLIDLCGIMGGENSAIDNNTKNVLLFVQTYNPEKIRQTSMSLAQRSEAAVLFEKGLDEELVKPSIILSINLIEKTSGGKSEKEIFDVYPNTFKQKFIITNESTLEKIIGIKISKKDILNYLESLGFIVTWKNEVLTVGIPSFRSKDIQIPEDLAEEIARIYGYHNLPTKIIDGDLPKPTINGLFRFENVIKQTLKSLGAYEVYNLSLVSKEMLYDKALKLKNPLGLDSEYLRTNLRSSLIENVNNNPQEKNTIHFFEVANIYIPKNNDLPEERLMLAGIIKNGKYRENKGIIESLFEELLINYSLKIEDGKGYFPNQRLVVESEKTTIGEFGNLENGLFYYEFNILKMLNSQKIINKYKEPAKFPSQVEDLTLVLPEKTKIGELIHSFKQTNKYINDVELGVIFENSYTFRIWYQHPDKTLVDKEVEKIRNEIIMTLKQKFGITIKN